MIVSLVLMSLALAWLGYESDWLRVRLPVRETLSEYDKRILTQLELRDREYQAWKVEQDRPRYKYGGQDTDLRCLSRPSRHCPG